MSVRRLQAAVTAVIAVVVMWFVVAALRPWLWFLDTTPTGGDLGAHVWSPAYLRDVLLPDWRLTGWSFDWYAGFPAFTFYMVIPSLLVVMVEAGTGLGVSWFAGAGIVGALGLASRRFHAGGALSGRVTKRWRTHAFVAGWMAWGVFMVVALDSLDGRRVSVGPLGSFVYNHLAFSRFLAIVVFPSVLGLLVFTLLARRDAVRTPATVAAVIAGVLLVDLPYGIALKLVVVAGMVALPVCAHGMARLGGLAFPGPALAMTATVLFLFDRSYNIYGGNFMSTMAGEFAYSLGLALAVLYIGVAAQGMRTGRHRVLAGVLLALCGLTHLFAAFFALAATAALFVVMPWRREALWARAKWTAICGAFGAALSAWWVVPFWWNRGLLNDMGWGKERRYTSALWSRSEFDYDFLANHPPLQVFVALALLGAVVGLWRRSRLTMALALTGLIFAVAFVVLPESRLWNVRLLPFYYLCVYLTALVGIGETVTAVADVVHRRGLVQRLRLRFTQSAAVEPEAGAEARPGGGDGDHAHDAGGDTEDGASTLPGSVPQGAVGRARRPVARPAPTLVGAAVAVFVVSAVLVIVGLPLRNLPWGSVGADGYRWGPFTSVETNVGSYWIEYDFEGYERKPPTADGGGTSEYRGLLNTMSAVGDQHGCGPSLWEYQQGRLGSYGTPMAPMLLPYWTDRCIGSMEGLYFEASATAPFHFLMQSELSLAPSRSQRDLPYGFLDVAAGVEHLQIMGVRYYLAFSAEAVAQARAVSDLVEVAQSGPWVVFAVLDSPRVEGLAELPVVVEGLPSTGDEWLEAAVGAFLMGQDGPLLATAGPSQWPRTSLDVLRPELEAARAEQTGGSARERAMAVYEQRLGEVAPSVVVPEPAVVSNVRRGDQFLSFSVDRTGVPVVVRSSYFPNWKVSGANGPWRVSPNLMVVVPTSTKVTMTYGRSGVELAAGGVTLVGVLAALWLAFGVRFAPHLAERLGWERRLASADRTGRPQWLRLPARLRRSRSSPPL